MPTVLDPVVSIDRDPTLAGEAQVRNLRCNSMSRRILTVAQSLAARGTGTRNVTDTTELQGRR